MRRWLLPALLMLLALISLLTLKSVVPKLATQQTFFFVIGFSIFFTMATQIRFEELQRWAWPLYITLNLLLIISYVYGLISGRTGRWIPILGDYNLQPSQLAIPITILMLTKIKGSVDKTTNLIKQLIFIFVPALLILIEPDLGTTLIYLFSTGTIIFLSDVSWKKLLILVSLALTTAVMAWFLVLKPYQKQRITSFINTDQDTQNAGYNAQQALIAAGSGQLWGRGLGQGIQSHLRFLPERQTDFIFASLAEEFGFMGSISVILIYVATIGFIIKTGLQTSSKEASYFCFSIATMTALHVGVNIGMNIGLLPITGLTLPLLSYGGSSLVSIMIMFGIVQNIALHTKPQKTLHLS